MISFAFEAIGTQWSIDILDSLSETKGQTLLNEINKRIEVFDKTYSRFRKDSLITEMSQKAGRYDMPPDAKPLLTLYKQLYQITRGAVTPLIGNVLSDAGYDAAYSLKPRTLHHPDTWEQVLDYTAPKLTIKKPAILDFGGGGKGYLTDIVGELLQAQGVHNFCIDASGDILYKNETNKPIRIGLEHPENPEQIIGVAELTNGSLCGSAGNRRKWHDFHHIISPHTLTSPTHIAAVWVIARTGLLADALTTSLFFTKPETLQNYFDFQYVIVNKDYTLAMSDDFPGEFFYNKS
jgi:thiamine biosynthesis lipoprotein